MQLVFLFKMSKKIVLNKKQLHILASLESIQYHIQHAAEGHLNRYSFKSLDNGRPLPKTSIPNPPPKHTSAGECEIERTSS